MSDRDLDISTRGGARLAPFFRPLGVVGRGMRSDIFGPDLASMESHICLIKKIKQLGICKYAEKKMGVIIAK